MTSDFSLKIPAELEAASQLRTAQFFVTKRPWLDLYGVHIRPVAPFGSASSKPFIDPALLHRCLPDELLFEVRPFESLLLKSFVSIKKTLGYFPITYEAFFIVYAMQNVKFKCGFSMKIFGVVENYKILQSKYDGSWRKMWLSRPRIRTDGLYVSRNTYIRAGIAEWKISNPVHVVCYFRYLRFYPSGRFLYKNSSQKVKDVAKFMNFRASKTESVHSGHYTLSNDKVEAAFLYPGLRPTVWRIRLRLRGTMAGANNRMDLLSLVTSGVNDGEVSSTDEDILGVVEGWQEDETHNPDVPAVTHKRGLTPFVFIPFEEILLGKRTLTFIDIPGRNVSFEPASGKDGLFCTWLITYSIFLCKQVVSGTMAGANNQMDLLSLVTSGVIDGEVSCPCVVEGWQEDEAHNLDVPAVTYKRDLTPLVFIPFEGV
ncbi:hypothetical protein RHGRI_031677 [Rhododendron griersonianum]|uniref:F-box protein n=1 Tax=Rhododendron griersonianum TaxID=479676 RepID=A0AAV6I8P4_9ERIC|nr:hypothetical protein RHGRI_031677 [Rhododendron griersonianum]